MEAIKPTNPEGLKKILALLLSNPSIGSKMTSWSLSSNPGEKNKANGILAKT